MEAHDHDNQWDDLVMAWKCEYKVCRLVWEFDCLHFTEYMPMSAHGIGSKQTWYAPDIR